MHVMLPRKFMGDTLSHHTRRGHLKRQEAEYFAQVQVLCGADQQPAAALPPGVQGGAGQPPEGLL